MASLAEVMQQKLEDGLAPGHLEVINESHNHSRPGNDTHFKLVVVSAHFEGQPLLARHRKVYQLLDIEMKGGIHALTIHPFTPAEWQERGESAISSPACRGGSKADIA